MKTQERYLVAFTLTINLVVATLLFIGPAYAGEGEYCWWVIGCNEGTDPNGNPVMTCQVLETQCNSFEGSCWNTCDNEKYFCEVECNLAGGDNCALACWSVFQACNQACIPPI